ncbi:ethanolamine kinase [Kalaharituber pfeilii]|nr:ethanolamine kinase [Kalaharituber pfeilii]
MASSSSSSSTAPSSCPRQLQAKIKYIPLSYNPHNSHSSATHLILTLFPDWEAKDLAFMRFTDGITNTVRISGLLNCLFTRFLIRRKKGQLLKCVNSTKDQDKDAVLLRAYGRETGILIDRERECSNHALLSSYGLAPPLLARFNNGLLYRYVAGKVCSVKDLSNPDIFLAIADRLGEWHGVLPVNTIQPPVQLSVTDPLALRHSSESSLWGVMQKWTDALPSNTHAEAARKQELLNELRFLRESGLKGKDGGVGLVFGHCDLLNGNVIILPEGAQEGEDLLLQGTGLARSIGASSKRVHFIDYEYATPCERAFDIANHFAEWGGFDCDYTLLPTRSIRRQFIRTYLQSYHAHTQHPHAAVSDEEIEALLAEVDAFRGIPGFYWGIWALIQDTISQIDFDYAAYAEVRLGEYWAWKKAFVAGGQKEKKNEHLREKKWAEE